MTIGRVTAQKDPAFFAQCVAAARAAGRDDIEWRWVGGGSPELEELLAAAGVTVTGWVAQDAVREHLADADVYLHTALWEGTPLAFLDAAGAGLPVIVRDAPYVHGLGVTRAPDTVSGVAGTLVAVLDLGEPRTAALRTSEEFLARHSPAATSRGLNQAYESALARRRSAR